MVMLEEKSEGMLIHKAHNLKKYHMKVSKATTESISILTTQPLSLAGLLFGCQGKRENRAWGESGEKRGRGRESRNCFLVFTALSQPFTPPTP